MMKNFFTNRWVMVTSCFITLSMLIWLIGPLFGLGGSRPLASGFARLMFILLILLLWISFESYRFISARLASRSLMNGIASQVPDPSIATSAAEIEILRKRMKQTISKLKKTMAADKKWGSDYLYRIPWYMFIGAPGSGKTTALINCGLRFPALAEGEIHAVSGVGGTRNCDWWFTDDAVFIDTAGRYTTQDSDKKADGAAWLGFLDLLKKSRSDRPLNGAIVTVSLADLLLQSEIDRDEYALSVRQRIQELYQRLGVIFPIYLMVTKTDLLSGFVEFFSDLGFEERAQVLGVTFPYSQAVAGEFDFSKAFQTQFAEIDKRLNARLIDRLQQDRDMQRRALVYGFTQQFSAVVPLLTRFIDHVFCESRYEQKPMLRGIYFTSGTQEGTPIDRVLGSMSRMLKIEQSDLIPAASAGRSFFLTNLLKEVVFPEASLAGFDENKKKKRKAVLNGAYACLGVFAVSLIAAWTFSYIKNEALVSEIEAKVDSIAKAGAVLPQPSGDNLNTVLPFLNELRDIPYGYREREKQVEQSLRFGLFQGDRNGVIANEAYQRALGTVFMPRMAMIIEDQIRNSPNNEIKYESLKAYLMLFDDRHFDPEVLNAFLAAYWEQTAGSDKIRTDLVSHLHAGLKNRPVKISWTMDDSLIKSARLSLASSSLADRIYARIRLLCGSQSIKPVRLSDMTGHSGAQIFENSGGRPWSAQLPTFFTYAGYHEGFVPTVAKTVNQMAEEETWVLGEHGSSYHVNTDNIQLLEAVRHRYLEDYVRNWDSILSGIRLKHSSSLSDSAMHARVLGAADSPLKKLLIGVAKEVFLVSSGKDNAAIVNIESGLMDGAKQVTTEILSNTPAVMLHANNQPEDFVDDHFEPLKSLVTIPAPGQFMGIDHTLALLNDFFQELSGYEQAGRGGRADIKPMASAERLKVEAERLSPPLRQILKGLIAATEEQAAAVNLKNIHKAVGGASSFCNKAISGRYPVNRSSRNDIMVADFNSVFSPGGELDDFFDSNLKQVVDTSGSVWKLRAGVETTSPVSASVLRQFQNADIIRRAFFRGAPSASVAADLRLVATEWPQVTLEYNGESHHFLPSDDSAWTLRWPAQYSRPTKLFAADAAQGIVVDGDWAIFRLFDKAVSDSSLHGHLRLVFIIEGRQVIFELGSSSILNPFKLKELGNFLCPG